ncbi:MAG: chemotaxis response regulator protein-glutamate methylesterase [Verrucomicrobiota bacterium]
MSKTRVLVVDDSAVLRRAISDLLVGDPDIEVVGHAANGNLALVRMVELKPDVVTLDIEMPIMDGLETLREMKKAGLTFPVIMCSTLTERGAMATLDVLSLGAACYVTKPSSSGTVAESIESLRRELIPKVKALGRHHNRYTAPPTRPLNPVAPSTAPMTGRTGLLTGQATSQATSQTPSSLVSKPSVPKQSAIVPPIEAPVSASPSSRKSNLLKPAAASPAAAPVAPQRSGAPGIFVPTSKRTSKVEAVIIGVSTGGPNALAVVLPALPRDLPVPVLVVQHMPPVFTKLVADRLNTQCPLSVSEAVAKEPVRFGKILIAPGDFHMVLEKEAGEVRVGLNQDPAVNFCRPAVDVMFHSAVATYGAGLLAVVLTGMGSDGAMGCQAVHEAGGQVIVQDAETSVVWGMPGAVFERGIAEAVLPLGGIANEIIRRVQASVRG